MDDVSAWTGRTQEKSDRLDPARSNALLASLGRAASLGEGDPLPALHHWLHFWDVRSPAETGSDGHPRRGGFLPPIALPRRMWAGGRLIFHAPLRLGDVVRRVSTIAAIEKKSGRSGELVFVTVEHALHGPDGRLAITEEQDLVYRDESRAPATAPEPEEAISATETVLPDPLLLFRYSALTMNGHRIHYDQPYATEVEHYAGLVVHGPLQATLLAGLAERALARPLSTFRFRGLAAAFAGEPLGLHVTEREGGADLWTSQTGVRRMAASAG